jgi:hypothetical protein
MNQTPSALSHHSSIYIDNIKSHRHSIRHPPLMQTARNQNQGHEAARQAKRACPKAPWPRHPPPEDRQDAKPSNCTTRRTKPHEPDYNAGAQPHASPHPYQRDLGKKTTSNQQGEESKSSCWYLRRKQVKKEGKYVRDLRTREGRETLAPLICRATVRGRCVECCESGWGDMWLERREMPGHTCDGRRGIADVCIASISGDKRPRGEGQ